MTQDKWAHRGPCLSAALHSPLMTKLICHSYYDPMQSSISTYSQDCSNSFQIFFSIKEKKKKKVVNFCAV